MGGGAFLIRDNDTNFQEVSHWDVYVLNNTAACSVFIHAEMLPKPLK